MIRAGETVRLEFEVPRRAFVEQAALPELVSQKTSLAVLGIPPRAFLELVRSARFPLPVTRLGKLRLVRRDALVSWFEGAARQAAERSPSAGAGDVLQALGLRLVEGGGR